jgi:hypothetical protein
MDDLRKTNYKHQGVIEAPEAEEMKVTPVEKELKEPDDLLA